VYKAPPFQCIKQYVLILPQWEDPDTSRGGIGCAHVLIGVGEVACRPGCVLEALGLDELVVGVENLSQVHRSIACMKSVIIMREVMPVSPWYCLLETSDKNA
jgi:hypothetical protein